MKNTENNAHNSEMVCKVNVTLCWDKCEHHCDRKLINWHTDLLSLQETQDAAQSNWETKNNRRREEKKSLHIASVDVDGLVHARRKQETETGTL